MKLISKKDIIFPINNEKIEEIVTETECKEQLGELIHQDRDGKPEAMWRLRMCDPVGMDREKRIRLVAHRFTGSTLAELDPAWRFNRGQRLSHSRGRALSLAMGFIVAEAKKKYWEQK